MDPYIKHLNELVYTVQMLSEELEIAYDIIDNLFEDEDYELKEEVLLEKKKWIQDAIKKEGSLRKTMKTKEGKNIPVSKLEKAAEKSGKTGKRARLALTLRKLSKKKLNEDKAALERAAMNPSGAYTPTPKTMKQRKEEEDEMTKASRAEQEKDYTKLTNFDLMAPSTAFAAAAGLPVPLNVAGALGAGMIAPGMYANRLMGADAARNQKMLEIEKIRKTAPAQPEDYAKAAKEAAERRKARGIQTYD